MDLDQLHTFLEIVRLKSFSKAAQTCYRTQPAISAQVRQLEMELRADLFERFGSRISLTTAGKIFAGYAEQPVPVRYYHRPLEKIVSDLRAAGFALRALHEPQPADEASARDPELAAKLRTQPWFLLVDAEAEPR